MDFNKEPVTQEEKYGKFIMDLQDENTAKQAAFQLELMENSGFAEAAVALGQYYKDTDLKKEGGTRIRISLRTRRKN